MKNKYFPISLGLIFLSACSNPHSQTPTSTVSKTFSRCEALVTEATKLNGLSFDLMTKKMAQLLIKNKNNPSSQTLACLDQNLMIDCSNEQCLIQQRNMK